MTDFPFNTIESLHIDGEPVEPGAFTMSGQPFPTTRELFPHSVELVDRQDVNGLDVFTAEVRGGFRPGSALVADCAQLTRRELVARINAHPRWVGSKYPLRRWSRDDLARTLAELEAHGG